MISTSKELVPPKAFKLFWPCNLFTLMRVIPETRRTTKLDIYVYIIM